MFSEGKYPPTRRQTKAAFADSILFLLPSFIYFSELTLDLPAMWIISYSFLVIIWAKVAECRMSSLSIVEDFDVVEQAGFGLLMPQIVFPIYLLFFSVAKKLSPAQRAPGALSQQFPLRLMSLFGFFWRSRLHLYFSISSNSGFIVAAHSS